ncbi:ubiquitin-like domain-containing protein [Streptomyces atroolivaceus]|uniref:Ubiquitin-like domain-containing protein n=1 Tax=Streptomyces atroolivaceus TaxID=66869 RepID=A0ABV9VC17_STRAZ
MTPRCWTPRWWAGRRPRGRSPADTGRPRGAPESLRRIVPRALVVAVLAGGTAAFLTQDKAVRVSVDGTSRTLHTFADDVGELLDAEGVTVGTRDTVAPAPATGLDDGDEVVVLRETRGTAPDPAP